MSAGAVRQGRVFVEIGADPKQFLSAVSQVNRQIADLGSSMVEVGAKLGAIGAVITAPLAAAAAQFGNLGSLLRDMQSYAGLASNDIAGLTKVAASLGLVLDKQTAVAALQLAASTTKMRLSLSAVAATVGSIVAPEFTGFAEAVSRVAKDASGFLRENRKIITIALSVGGALTGIGFALTSVGGALKAFGSNTSFVFEPLTRMIKLLGIVSINLVRLTITAGLAGAAGAIASLRGALASVLTTLAGVGKAVAVTAVRFASLVAIVGATGLAATLAVFLGLASQTMAVLGAIGLAVTLLTKRVIALRAGWIATQAAMVAAGAAQGALKTASFFGNLPKLLFNAGASLVKFTIFLVSSAVSVAAFAVGLAAIAAAVYVAGGALLKAAGGFDGLKKSIGGVVTQGVAVFRAAMPGMIDVATMAATGAYDAFARGDLAGAVAILWDGAAAAWTVGSSAIMGVLDPWIEAVQNSWGNMTTFLGNTWDRAFASLATSDWGGYILGAMDNVVNALAATWDYLVGVIQKGWAKIQGIFTKGFDVDAEIRRIDRENQQTANERSILRPGFEGRTNLTDAEKARIRADAERRIADRTLGNEQAAAGRRRRTEERASDRPGEVRDAIAALRRQVGEAAANVPDRAPLPVDQIRVPAEVRGTFSAFAARGLGSGTKGIAEQQLDILKQIAANTKEQVRVAP